MAPSAADTCWTIPADLDRVAPLVLEAARFLEDHGLTNGSLSTAQLALEEIVTNAIRHSYEGDRSREVLVRVAVDGEGVWLTVEDDGRPFDPLCDAPTLDLSAPLQARAAGGMGIFLLRNMLDDWRYERAGLTNRNRMRVGLDAGDAAAARRAGRPARTLRSA